MSRYYDGFVNDSSSDEGGDTSSEDEIDIILHGTPEQRRKLQLHHRRQSQGAEVRQDLELGSHNAGSSSEDEFEKEMNAELTQQVKVLEDSRGKHLLEASGVSSVAVPAVKTTQVEVNVSKNEFYDEIYFDSDEEDDATNARSSRKQTHAVISNDDLLYDPDMDDEDQKWVDRQRQSHRGPSAGGAKKGKKSKKPNSDALLDCPACMTTLCLDCQRHEVYKHQYRAMFVMNCNVDKTEVLQYPEQATKKKKQKKKVSHETNLPKSDNPSPSDMFNPVRCTECNTVVGVVDQDEVYHFFNILASHT
ncbi:hypothetical protein BsWGS_10307 [Bradybaena similaris]